MGGNGTGAAAGCFLGMVTGGRGTETTLWTGLGTTTASFKDDSASWRIFTAVALAAAGAGFGASCMAAEKVLYSWAVMVRKNGSFLAGAAEAETGAAGAGTGSGFF